MVEAGPGSAVGGRIVPRGRGFKVDVDGNSKIVKYKVKLPNVPVGTHTVVQVEHEIYRPSGGQHLLRFLKCALVGRKELVNADMLRGIVHPTVIISDQAQ